MRIEDLKRWHWIVIGLFAGLLLSYLYSSLEPDEPHSISQLTFERDAVRARRTGQPHIRNVVVYPPREGVTTVLGEYLIRDPNERTNWIYRAFALHVREPYVPVRHRPPDAGPNLTVRQYLAYLAAEHEHFAYRYAWWREPRMIYIVCTLGAVVLIGGIWPTVVNVLVGAGLGRRSPPEPEYDLDRFGQHEPDQPASEPKRVMTAEEQDQLKAVEQELERKLQSGEASLSTAAEQQEQGDAPVRQLSAAPLEQSDGEHQRQDKEYAGEFYPTVAHAPKKKHDDGRQG